eukprot:5521076-Amphidinium_carterae.1
MQEQQRLVKQHRHSKELPLDKESDKEKSLPSQSFDSIRLDILALEWRMGMNSPVSYLPVALDERASVQCVGRDPHGLNTDWTSVANVLNSHCIESSTVKSAHDLHGVVCSVASSFFVACSEPHA